jgi:hypothetical protein
VVKYSEACTLSDDCLPQAEKLRAEIRLRLEAAIDLVDCNADDWTLAAHLVETLRMVKGDK